MGFNGVEVESFRIDFCWFTVLFRSGLFCVCCERFCDPNSADSVACADFEDSFYVICANNLVQKEPGFF